jgi:hypothetical protein
MSRISPKEKVKRFLLAIDLFGVEPKLQMKSSSKFNSIIGGLISITFYIVTGLGILYFGQELFLREFPEVVESVEYEINPRRFNLTSNKFALFFGVSDSKDYFIDPTVYQLQAEFTSYYKDRLTQKTQVVPLRFESCEAEKHFSGFAQQISMYNLSNYQCINTDDLNQVYLEGFWVMTNYTELNIVVGLCNNSTSSAVCKPREQIVKRLTTGSFLVSFTDTIFNPIHFDHPESHVIRQVYTSFSTQLFKQLLLYFNNIDYVTDSGLVIENLNNEPHLRYERNKELFTFGEPTDIVLTNVLRLSDIKNSYRRRYMKVQDFISHVGGLLKGIMTGIQVVLGAFLNTNYFHNLINESYIHSESESEREERKNADKTVMAHINKPHIENNYIKGGNNGNIQFASLKRFDKAKRVIKLSAWEFISQSLCKRCTNHLSTNLRFFTLGHHKIRNSLDIVGVIKHFQELDLFKEILFDQNGKVLLNFMNQNMRIDQVDMNKLSIDISEVITSYHNLEENNVLNKSLKNLFEINFKLDRSNEER